MTQPLALLNGQFIPADQAVVPVYDAGFMLGATVTEQLRTFAGRLFQLDQHLHRLMRSLEIVGVDPGYDQADLARFAEQLVERNHALLESGDDLGLSIFVTPGPYPAFSPTDESDPLVCMHTYPQPFHLWCDKYEQGESLIVTEICQVPNVCWPAELKCRSRMHYYLADRRAREAEPGARALLLDPEGKVLEASTASVVAYRADEGLFAPPAERILPGISFTILAGLAHLMDVPFIHRDVVLDDLMTADEVILCSTSPCLLPVTRLNGRSIGSGSPGELFVRAIEVWSEMVGVDIRDQAKRFAKRSKIESEE